MATLDELLSRSAPEAPAPEPYIPSSVSTSFITGPAGSGKTFQQREAIRNDPNYGVLCATTGIAAINLGATTLNSLLRFFDTDSLRDNFSRGRLATILHRIGLKTKRLVIDEVSMMDGRQLDYLFKALETVNDYEDMKSGKNAGEMGIVLTGDFCQLPPVKAPWAFQAESWKHFEHNTTKLDKIWRQDNPDFLAAINAARAGQGVKCSKILKDLGVKFVGSNDGHFDGTTIMSKNDQVDNFNFAALLDIKKPAFGLNKSTWGELAGEWKNIPDVLTLKVGAYVMILSNDTSGNFEYANGDCGYVEDKQEDAVYVRLVRTSKVVRIDPIIRHKTISGKDGEDKGWDPFFSGEEDEATGNWAKPPVKHIFCGKECAFSEPELRWGPWGTPSYNCNFGTWNAGAVKYTPLRLAWATTVHKSQGLTLDNCQIDIRDHFFGNAAMAYVALSRCRTPEGLTIVGSPEKLATKIKVDPLVKRWI